MRTAERLARVLSNGRFTTLLTGDGAGCATWDGLALTAWSGDRVEDADGLFVYLRDLDDGAVWSIGRQPVPVEPSAYDVSAEPGVVRIARRDGDLEAVQEVCVAPQADVELRRLRVSNHGSRRRRLAVTTVADVVLYPPAAHAAHPAFAKLFVQTEWTGEALVARRRARSAGDRVAWMGQALLGDGPLEWDSARASVLGRGRTVAAPRALASALAGTAGSVLDPVLALRRTVTLAPGASTALVVVLAAASTRDALLAALAAHHDRAAVEAAFAGATSRERELRARLGLDDAAADRLQVHAAASFYGETAPAAADTSPARAYWHGIGARVRTGESVVPAAPTRTGDAVCEPAPPDPSAALPAEELRFDNGYGGFSADGSEYVIRLPADGTRPPMPWVNVVANERFGFLVSEAGAGCTWSGNSRENRLTPWYNDPIADPYGEALYLRDETSGEFWSPLPGPVASGAPVEVRHGFGYSRWRQASHGLAQDVAMFVPSDDPVKVVWVRLTNTGTAARRLTLFSYARLVLGVLPTESGASVVSGLDPQSGALMARNPLNGDFAGAVVFGAALADAPILHTADRAAFLGPLGSPARPAAVCDGGSLDGRAGAGLDPCIALEVPVGVAPGETFECAFLLGEAPDAEAVRGLLDRYREPGAVPAALEATRAVWRATLSAVQVQTPSPGLDVMLNGWLTYQNLSCRLWGRTAFYQSGGAFGFRDQLQDAAALVYVRPELTRAQIVLHAGHQFVEGDVLHWWHPPRNRGTRTRFSDDLVWLPYVAAFYVRATGDWSVLDEAAGFVTARPLADGEDEAYLPTEPAAATAPVYEHCGLALDRACTKGAHGLPLMGTGDWNDGMNRVGREGRGESVWLGFFLHHVITLFLPLCERRGDHERAARYEAYRAGLRIALDTAGWDGEWYCRAYYDDGTPLGSADNDECRIDALAQAWAVISGAAPPARAAQAMDAVERMLVADDPGMVRLLTPPFDRSSHDPGYIKGYVPGIRENGGQYTHAALWVVRALAELGRRDRAATLLERLGPVHHARSREAVEVYQVEPYVVAADVYGVAPHVGRGGWTWYTGSAGWMYRVALESVLGFTLEGGDTLRVRPCIPDAWPGFRVVLRLVDGTRYDVSVMNPSGDASSVVGVEVDGRAASSETGIALVRDGGEHRVVVTLGASR